jgi:hypothetical protein
VADEAAKRTQSAQAHECARLLQQLVSTLYSLEGTVSGLYVRAAGAGRKCAPVALDALLGGLSTSPC